jgi:glutathione S-transferase
MKLFYMKGACSLASYISLIEAGAKFEGVEVDHATHRARDGENLNVVNGKGYVPVLRLDSGAVLTENVAVLSYIGDLNPGAKLAPPEGTFERYQLLEFLAYIGSEIHKNFGPLFDPKGSEDVKRFVRGNLNKRMGWLEQALGSRPFLMGTQFTVADAYLYVVLSWSTHVGIDLSQWPALEAHNERVGARPSAVAARKAEGID